MKTNTQTNPAATSTDAMIPAGFRMSKSGKIKPIKPGSKWDVVSETAPSDAPTVNTPDAPKSGKTKSPKSDAPTVPVNAPTVPTTRVSPRAENGEWIGTVSTKHGEFEPDPARVNCTLPTPTADEIRVNVAPLMWECVRREFKSRKSDPNAKTFMARWLVARRGSYVHVNIDAETGGYFRTVVGEWIASDAAANAHPSLIGGFRRAFVRIDAQIRDKFAPAKTGKSGKSKTG